MKKLALIPLTLLFLCSVQAQDSKTTPTAKKKTMHKEHVCTAACADGAHAYVHGEKGHKCTDACTAMHKAGAKAVAHGEKGHVCSPECAGMQGAERNKHMCSEACKDGKHAYAHGEKGHTCSAECKHHGHDH